MNRNHDSTSNFSNSLDDKHTRNKSEEIIDNETENLKLIESAPIGIVVFQSNKLMYINPTTLEIFGYKDKEEIIKSQPNLFLAGNDADEIIELEIKRIDGNINLPNTRETIGKRKDGSIFPMRLISKRIIYLGRRSLLLFIEDLTNVKKMAKEKEQLEIKLERSQKMESLGILAGGIAHDFNNLLQGLLGNITLALVETTKDEVMYNYLKEMENIALSAADLSQQMLDYSGKGEFFFETINLNEFIKQNADLFHRKENKSILFQYELYHEDLVINGDKTQIRQVLLNLISNAIEASKEHGKIIISTGVAYLTHATVDQNYFGSLDTFTEGEYAYIEVKDEGSGFGEEIKEKIFDPFYTTKFTGRGLGLAVVSGVIRGHNGLIQVLSKRNEGAIFRTYFKRSLQPIKPKAPLLKKKLHFGKGKAIICDDDEIVLKVTKKMLERIGYQVTATIEGKDAIDEFKKVNGEVNFVLLDLSMPNMNGIEVYKQMHAFNDKTPIILTSGYSEHELSSKYAGIGFKGFLQKPYNLDQLSQKLMEFLDIKT